ncbi:MAG: hypothetical protein Q4C47_08660, partial [Planctomycetia bacterium]|nr:hypothetical protein [Planctomycetia bacterium]
RDVVCEGMVAGVMAYHQARSGGRIRRRPDSGPFRGDSSGPGGRADGQTVVSGWRWTDRDGYQGWIRYFPVIGRVRSDKTESQEQEKRCEQSPGPAVGCVIRSNPRRVRFFHTGKILLPDVT